MKILLAATAAVTLLAAPPAMAQTISGKYLITINKFCQLVATYNFGSANNVGNFVNEIESSGSNIKFTILQATFNAKKGTAAINGVDDGGDVEIFQFTGAQSGQLGNAIAETPDTGTASYSNTPTTFTINGQVLNAQYGQVSAKGVAGLMTFQGAFTNQSGQNCAEQGTAQAQ
jgi:hypothetical protein